MLQAKVSVTSSDEQRDLTFPSSEQMPTCSPLSSRLIWLIFTELCGDTISRHLLFRGWRISLWLAKCCWLTFYPTKWNARKSERQKFEYVMDASSHMCQCTEALTLWRLGGPNSLLMLLNFRHSWHYRALLIKGSTKWHKLYQMLLQNHPQRADCVD